MMKPTLLACIVSTLPLVAFADATLYGTLKGGFQRDSLSNGPSNNGIHNMGTLLGFKGSEQLNKELQLIWQIESDVPLTGDKKEGTLGTRQTFVSLDGGQLGQIRIGYLNSSLKELYAVDQWTYSGHFTHGNFKDQSQPGVASTANGGVNGLAIFSNPGVRKNNAIAYTSDTFYGFNFNAVYSFGNNKSATVSKASDAFSVGLNYGYGNFSAHYAYQREMNPLGANNAPVPILPPDNKNPAIGPQISSSPQTADLHYLEADYKDDRFFFGLGVQYAKGYDWTDGSSGSSKSLFIGTNQQKQQQYYSPAEAGLKTKQAALSAAYTFQNVYTVKASLAKGWNQEAFGKTIADSGYQQAVIGIAYKMSKRTSTELSYGRLKLEKGALAALNKQDTTFNSVALSLAHNF